MTFNSYNFILFFIFVFVLYYSIPDKWRWLLLLMASYFFYMCWKAEYILLILISTIVDYIAAIQISKSLSRSKKKFFLILSLVINFGILFVFKYFIFFFDSAQSLFPSFASFDLDHHWNLLLPIGISFYTLQTVGYTIDVYRGKIQPERHFGKFALYVSFFPQLVAGPIERASNLLPQLKSQKVFHQEKIVSGMRLVLWGLFKKVVIADRLAILVDHIYNSPQESHGLLILIASYFFAFQIYCDFSGYTDIARGTARMLGIDLMLNFRQPYLANSISDFWQRWHISLSTWMRDYLYIPLGGNRCKIQRWILNIFVVFVISGLWHGANWTFVIWGLLHGFYYLFGHLNKIFKKRNATYGQLTKIFEINFFRRLTTFHLVLFSWIFFRANSLKDAILMISKIFNFSSYLSFHFKWMEAGVTKKILGLSKLEFLFSIFLMAFLLMSEYFQFKPESRMHVQRFPLILRWGLYLIGTLSCLYLAIYNGKLFIYFQF